MVIVKNIHALVCCFVILQLSGVKAETDDYSENGRAIDQWLSYERTAEYEALVTEVRPVMRDGMELDCDLAVPAINGKPVEGKFPGVVNNLTPYALIKIFYVNQIKELATLGYQGLTCRVRGSGDSDGDFSYIGEPEEWNDSHDLVEWLAAQPGSNGKIAFEGASYGGLSALQAAIRQAPHLVTIIPQVPASDLYLDFIYRGGVKSRPYTAGSWPIVTSLMNFPRLNPWKIWGHWYAHRDFDDFWRNSTAIHWVEAIEVPMLLAPGWADDGLPNGGVRVFEKLDRSDNRNNVWMYVGSWDHDMASFQRNVVIAWLDYWLQDRKDAPLPPARVVSYETGSDQPYRTFSTWPPVEANKMVFSLGVDGSLAHEPGEEGTVSFDQHALSGLVGRPETISFTSSPLSKDLVIAGDMIVQLHATFDAPEAMLHAQMFYRDAEGEEQLIKEGWLNVLHRHSHSEPAPIPIGESIRVSLNIGATHHRVKAGNVLVLKLSGVDTWDWQGPSSRVTTSVATGINGSTLELTVLP